MLSFIKLLGEVVFIPFVAVSMIGIVILLIKRGKLSERKELLALIIALPILFFVFSPFVTIVSRRYIALLNISCMVLSAYALWNLDAVFGLKNKKNMRALFCFFVFIFATGCIIKALRAPQEKVFLKESHGVIKDDISNNSFEKPVILDLSRNELRLDYYTGIKAYSIPHSNESQELIKAEISYMLGKLFLKNDVIYFTGIYTDGDLPAFPLKSKYNDELHWENLYRNQYKCDEAFLIYRLKTPEAFVGRKVGELKVDIKNNLVCNGDFKELEQVSTADSCFGGLRERGISYFNKHEKIEMPAGWRPNSGDGWKAEAVDATVEVLKSKGKNSLIMRSQGRITVINKEKLKKISDTAYCELTARGKPGTVAAVFIYKYNPEGLYRGREKIHDLFFVDDHLRCFRMKMPKLPEGFSASLGLDLAEGEIIVQGIGVYQ